MAEDQVIEPINDVPDQDQGPGPSPSLTEENRKKLDTIVGKMVGNKESDETIKRVVEDFKSKYATPTTSFGRYTPPTQKVASESTAAPKVRLPTLTGETGEQFQTKKYGQAVTTLDNELRGNNDLIPGIIKGQKQQAQAANNLTSFAERPRTDQPLTPSQQLGEGLTPQEKPVDVSDQDVNDFMQQIQQDPTAGKAFLQHISQAKPDKAKSIKEATYVNDAMNRLGNDPDGVKKNKIFRNAQKIEKGDLDYSIQGGILTKPENVWESIGTGYKEKNKAFADYDLFNSAQPGDAIKELEKRRNDHDPDEAVPVPKGFLAGLGGGMAGQPLRGLVAGKVVGGATLLIPGAEELAPAVDRFVSAAQSGDDFRKLSYAHSLQQNYNQLRNDGVTPELAYAQAQDVAKKESLVDAVSGAAMMYGAGAISNIKLPSFAASNGFKGVVTTALKQGAKGIGEAGAIGLIQGAAQQAKNEIKDEAGISHDTTGKDISESLESGALFTLGMAALAKGGSLLSGKTRTELLQGLSKATPDQVQKELGNQLIENHITPEEAVKAEKDINEHRDLDQSVPDNITPENRLKILDKIDRRNELEKELETKDKAYHPDIKEKIKAVNEDILELSKDKVPKDNPDALSQNENDAPRGTVIKNYNNIIEDEYKGGLFKMQQSTSSAERAAILSGMPQRIYERMEKDPSIKSDPEAQRQLQELRGRIQKEGLPSEEELRNMPESQFRDASRRLFKAIGGDMALSKLSPEATSGEGIKPGDVIVSKHLEGPQQVRSISEDGKTIFVEGAADHHVHEIPIDEVSLRVKKSAENTSSPQGELNIGQPVSESGKEAIKEAVARKKEVEDAGFEFLAQEDDGGPYNKKRQYGADEVPIGIVSVKEEGKGLGTLGYILKGEEYLKKGRHLVSDAPHIPEARTAQAEGVWKKLVKLGLATETSPGSYKYGGEREVSKGMADNPEIGDRSGKPPIDMHDLPFEPEAGDVTRLAHKNTEELYEELGTSGRIPRETKEDTKLESEADELIKNGYDFEGKATRVLDGDEKFSDTEQVAFAKMVGALKAKLNKLDVNDPEFDKLQDKIELFTRASDKTGSETGAALRARKMFVLNDQTLSDYLKQDKESLGVDELTPEQKTKNKKEYEDISEAQKEYDKKVKDLEEENAKLRAEAEVKKAKNKSTKGEKKTHEDYVKDRKSIIEEMRADLLKAAKGQGGLTASVPGAAQLAAIAPHVAKLVKSLVEEGVDKLEDIVKSIHNDLKDVVDVSEKDIKDIIAGDYEKPVKTKNELAEKLRDLKTLAKLQNRLEDLNNGEVPKKEAKKIERNVEIAALKKQIADHPLTKLVKTKDAIARQIKEVEKKLESGDFTKENKEPIALDKEGIQLKDKLNKLRQEREVRILKQQYASRSKIQKGLDVIAEIGNTPRALMSSLDFSAPLRQGLFGVTKQLFTHPGDLGRQFSFMFKASKSQKVFDRWFADLKEAPDYQIMKDSGLPLSDPHDPKLTAKEEAFMSNYAEKIPIVGKFIKASENAYVGFLNKMRVDIFRRATDGFAANGKTFANSPELYKAMADYVGAATGRGRMAEVLEKSSPILSAAFFSPRLIASRINLLTNWFNPKFYTKVPKEVRVQYFKDMAKFIGTGMLVLGLAKLGGAEVEDDPTSSDFGKIKSGNTRWDIWGGFQQYIRLASQLYTGRVTSSTSGKVTELNEGRNKTRADVLFTFARGKLAPLPAETIDLLAGKDVTGKPATLGSEALKNIPLVLGDITEAFKDKGVQGALGVGIPSMFGVGVQTYGDSKSGGTTGGSGAGGSYQIKEWK